MAKGGKRPGAGRPKGSTDKLRIGDHFTDADIKRLVVDAKKMAKEDPQVLKYLMDQIFGRAPQGLEHSGPDGQDIIFKWLTDE